MSHHIKRKYLWLSKGWITLKLSIKKQSSLLNERMRISKDRIDELELKLKAGRVDVSVLAKEILTLARAEIAIEPFKAQLYHAKAFCPRGYWANLPGGQSM